MGSVDPTPEQFKRFAEDVEGGRPIVMINLLRYRERADYPADSGASPCSGREAYQRYGEVTLKKVASVAGRPIWMGSAQACVIAPKDEVWDDAVLVEYPSKEAFLKMVAMPDYQAVVFHRTAALADSRLIATVTGASALGG